MSHRAPGRALISGHVFTRAVVAEDATKGLSVAGRAHGPPPEASLRLERSPGFESDAAFRSRLREAVRKREDRGEVITILPRQGGGARGHAALQREIPTRQGLDPPHDRLENHGAVATRLVACGSRDAGSRPKRGFA